MPSTAAASAATRPATRHARWLVALVACSARMAPITSSFTVTGTATIRARSFSVSPTRFRSAASVVASALVGPTPLTRAPFGS